MVGKRRYNDHRKHLSSSQLVHWFNIKNAETYPMKIYVYEISMWLCRYNDTENLSKKVHNKASKKNPNCNFRKKCFSVIGRNYFFKIDGVKVDYFI